MTRRQTHPFLDIETAAGMIDAMLRSLLLLMLLCVLAIGARGQSADSDFLIRVWQSDEGLPGNVARSLGQTDDGILWVVTAEGLARFDGIGFETISSSGNGRNPQLLLGLIRVFTPADGGVWVATLRGGLHRVRNNQLERIVADFDDPQAGHITQVVTVEESVYFVRQERIWKLGPDGERAIQTPDPEVARAIAKDARGQALRGRKSGGERSTRLVDRKGGTWRIRNGRLFYRAKDDPSPSTPLSEVGNRMAAHDLLEDREGNLWIASPVQGLIRIRHRRAVPISTRQGTYETAIKTAVRTRDGTWWIASRSGGLDRIRDGVLDHIEVLARDHSRQVSCLFEDSKGRLWACAQDGSVYQATEDGIAPQFKRDPSGLSQIKAMAEDSLGRLWFGGKHGLFRWDGEQIEHFNEEPVIANAVISTLAIGSRDVLHAGTIDGRVFTFDGRNFSLLGEIGDERGKWISAVLPLDSGEIWVSTIGSGLFLHLDGRWHRFGRESGIPDERLTALISDSRDSLWLGSLGGILRAHRSELIRWATEEAKAPQWQRLDRSDGLMTRECAGGSQPGAFRTTEGTLWFPTTTGLAGVRPERIEINRIPPEIHFDPVEINGVPHPAEEGTLVAGPGRVRLGFHFTGLSLSAPEKVTYRIRLSPIDDDFHFIDDQRRADYESIPPGRYTFEVMAANGDGTATPRAAAISLRIRPHFWETGWFVTLATIAVLLLAIGVGWLDARRRSRHKIRALRLKGALEAERSRISRDLHDDIGASLTELSIRSALAAENRDDARLRPSLDQLALNAKHVVSALDEIVWATNPSKDSLPSLIEYLGFFARRFLSAVEVALHTDIQREIPDFMIGPRRRHNVVLATREAINNAVKHAQPDSISLKVHLADNQLVVQIVDDGNGFDVEEVKAGNGLSNLRQRMEECGGDCLIESVHGKGTTITLTLPLPVETHSS